jgi:KDO2-lipid IV(A) lauroyltransferase
MKLLFKILTSLSFSLNRILGVCIGYLFNLGGKNKRLTQQNINLCFPNLQKNKQDSIVKHSLVELGKSITESFFIWGRSFNDNMNYVSSITRLELIKNNKPTILLVPHFGGFEITGRVLSLTRPTTFLYQKAKNKDIDALIFNARNQENLTMVATNNKGVAQLSKVLKDGGMIGILPDQYPKQGGVEVDFFNLPTKTTTLLAKLANKYQAEVLLTYCLRNDTGYDIVIEKADILSGNTLESTAKMNSIIQKLVEKYPEQYIWNYKKFRNFYNYNN